jgi:hypothetical protein
MAQFAVAIPVFPPMTNKEVKSLLITAEMQERFKLALRHCGLNKLIIRGTVEGDPRKEDGVLFFSEDERKQHKDINKCIIIGFTGDQGPESVTPEQAKCMRESLKVSLSSVLPNDIFEKHALLIRLILNTHENRDTFLLIDVNQNTTGPEPSDEITRLRGELDECNRKLAALRAELNQFKSKKAESAPEPEPESAPEPEPEAAPEPTAKSNEDVDEYESLAKTVPINCNTTFRNYITDYRSAIDRFKYYLSKNRKLSILQLVLSDVIGKFNAVIKVVREGMHERNIKCDPFAEWYTKHKSWFDKQKKIIQDLVKNYNSVNTEQLQFDINELIGGRNKKNYTRRIKKRKNKKTKSKKY